MPVAEAQRRLFAAAAPVDAADVPLIDALGRWAAAPVPALRTQPAHDLSSMDGFAIRAADLPGPWRVIGESAAGRAFPGAIGAGEAVRIFTGAAMPAGADCVMVQEEAARDGDRLTLDGEGPRIAGRNVRRRGLDFHTGDTIIAAEDAITPARLALAAAAGHTRLPVRRRVRVAIASTGDELAEPADDLDPDRLPESNRLLLRALLARLPADTVDLGILPDRLDVIRDAFAGARCDLLVTSGGASVGDHDLVRPALLAAGATIDFWRIALRPGKPMLAGRLGDAMVLGLPGNPVSAFVTATLFVLPVVARMAGAPAAAPARLRATLGEPLPPNGGREDYMRAVRRDGRLHAARVQDSAMLRALGDADCLIVRPADAPAAAAGDSAEFLPLW